MQNSLWVILVLLQVFLSLCRAQEEVEFPEEEVAAVDSDYDAEYVDVNDVDYSDYDEKTYDYEFEKEPVIDVIEEEEDDILEDLDAVAMDDIVTLTLSEERTTTPPLPRRNVFVTLVIGGFSPTGPLPSIEVLSPRIGLRRLPALPYTTGGGQEYCSAAYTGRDLISCTSGSALLTPYGWVYTPGSCYNLNLFGPISWQPSGGALTSYRRSSTISRVGRFLLAMGGYRPKTKRRLRSVEVFDSKSPEKGWRRSGQLQMPVGVSEHCSVAMAGPTGKEVIVTGGKGRGDRVIKLSIKTGKWYSLTRLEHPRKQHACTKVTLNGRKGLVVSGGMSVNSFNLTTVEFYDVSSGQWVRLPDLQRGRRNHAMVVEDGRLMVTGGMRGKSKKDKGNYLKDSEVFNGKRWVDSDHRLRTGRQGFTVVKVPAGQLRKAAGAKSKSRTRSQRLPKKRKD